MMLVSGKSLIEEEKKTINVGTETKTIMLEGVPEDVMWRHGKKDNWHLKQSKEDVDCFERVKAKTFPLRGKRYMYDKKKYPSKDAAFALVCCKCFKTDHQLLNSAVNIDSLRDYIEENEDNEYFIMNWLVPGHYTVVNLYVRKLSRGVDKEFDTAYEAFKKGDAKYRSERFKYIPQIIEAPSVVKAAVNTMLGGLRPVLIGNKLSCHHFTGKNYVEVNVDTGSSRIVNAVAGILVKGFKSIVANTAFLIEGRNEDELPERMLAVHKNIKVSLTSVCIDYDHKPPETPRRERAWFGGVFRKSKKTRHEGKKDKARHGQRTLSHLT